MNPRLSLQLLAVWAMCLLGLSCGQPGASAGHLGPAPQDTAWLEVGLAQPGSAVALLTGEALGNWLPDSLLGAAGQAARPVHFHGQALAYAELQQVYWQDEPFLLLRLADHGRDPAGMRAHFRTYCEQQMRLPVAQPGDFAWIATEARTGQLRLEAGLGYRFFLQLSGPPNLPAARYEQAWEVLRAAWQQRSPMPNP